MRRSKRVAHDEEVRADREQWHDSVERIDTVMRERAEASDQAFNEELERWKAKDRAKSA